MDPSGVAQAEPAEQMDAHPPSDVQRQALQMLTLAQRTAEDHVASARLQADKIHADARAKAEQILRDAQVQADAVRREANEALSDAGARAAQTAKDAQAHAENARRGGDKIVSEARAQAAEIAKEAQGSADGLRRQAEQRYEEMVGSLAAKRASLQQQIEALQEFERDYRGRLLTFMQAQLRALWVDEPRVDGEIAEIAEIEQPGRGGNDPASTGTAARPSGNDRVAASTGEPT